ncbi:acyltransferase family protein [Janibacter cremeus]|uniref:acyltransferase family protein n=1 Tax=Janibacter cremeus TaxID=1285192 RepID=UPI0023F8E045|nr:acyltransferase family protein [Janibacter cremeus]WEV78888.1 acyltransferase family protein [Janibacter cremeus]
MTASAEAPPRRATDSRPGAPSGLRKDIQGLRALAVTLVVLFHLWPDSLSGGYVGVDVFLVISGYLITTHLLKKPPRTSHDLWAFWARRLRRLLPASLVVLATTAVATRLVAPSTAWEEISRQIIASTLYVQNWALASSSVDYMDAGAMSSPVQHFWSLSVEEQFYLLWPLLIFFVTWVVLRRRKRTGAAGPVDAIAGDLALVRLARTLIGAVVLLSLGISVWVTSVQPAAAYFITPTRMWELGLGGLIATVAATGARAPRGMAGALLAWAGIAAVLASAWWYTSATPFPGAAALVPVLGTAAVIVADSDHPLSPTALLRHRPVQWLGDVSYSVYLWHWPLIALLPYASGGDLGILDTMVVLAATLALAAVTKVHVEDRFRFLRPQAPVRYSYQLSAAGMIAVAVLGSVGWTETEVRNEVAKKELAAVEQEETPCLGAAALAKGACNVAPDGEVVPTPELAKKDKADIDEDECFPEGRYDQRLSCSFGSGGTKIALVGNSHARHWLPALRELGKEKGWTIDTYIISRCAATDAKQEFDTDKKSEDCHDWGQWAQEETKGDVYDLVITSERQSAPIDGYSASDSGPPATEGYESYLSTWAEAGTNVLAIKDPTKPTFDVPECVAENPDDLEECSGSPEEWKVDPDPLVEAAKNLDHENVGHVSFDDLVCSSDRCRGVTGGVITYYDSSHLSATYVRTMAPYMAEPIEEALAKGD